MDTRWVGWVTTSEISLVGVWLFRKASLLEDQLKLLTVDFAVERGR